VRSAPLALEAQLRVAPRSFEELGDPSDKLEGGPLLLRGMPEHGLLATVGN